MSGRELVESITFWRIEIVVLAEARVTTSGELVSRAKLVRITSSVILPTDEAKLLIY